jgi:predicted transcriptional regulator
MLIQLQVSENVSRRFDELAQYAGQSREQAMLDALEAYLARVAEEDARIDEARAQVARGEVVDAEDTFAEAEAMLLARGMTREQLAMIKEEVEREADAFYGVPLQAILRR